eukprot:6517777-Lingulodinium_polyedra.AAC.1
MARARNAYTCNPRAAVAANRRFNRIVARRFANAAQRRGRIDARRTLARSIRGPRNGPPWNAQT